MIVRGPLGVGKTTVSERLARALGGVAVSIDRILEEQRLEEWDDDRISLRSFLRANDFAVDRARPLLARGTAVVVEGNFYWKEAIDDLIRRLEVRARVVTLHASLATCIARDRRRPETPPGRSPHAGDRLGTQATAAVYRLVARVAYGARIDASGPIDATVRAVLRATGRGTGRGPEALRRSTPRPGRALPPGKRRRVRRA